MSWVLKYKTWFSDNYLFIQRIVATKNDVDDEVVTLHYVIKKHHLLSKYLTSWQNDVYSLV